MDSDLLQNIKNNLTRRLSNFDKINSASPAGYKNLFFFYLVLFYQYITTNNIILTILDRIEVEAKDIKVNTINLEDFVTSVIKHPTGLFREDEKEHVCFSYLMLKKLVSERINESTFFAIAAACEEKLVENCDRIETLKSYVSSFKSTFIEPLYNYILERLDENQLTISIFLRYKQKCEWFQRDKVRSLQVKNTNTGEDKLKQHLFEYLHDQGWNFVAEVQSPKGKIDVVLNPMSINSTINPITTTRPKNLITEVKIFDGVSNNKGKSYIIRGFNQTHTYTNQHNENIAYLVIYKICVKELRLDLDCHNSLVPFVKIGNTIIYILVIDVALYENSVSARKNEQPTIISVKDFLNTDEKSEES